MRISKARSAQIRSNSIIDQAKGLLPTLAWICLPLFGFMVSFIGLKLWTNLDLSFLSLLTRDPHTVAQEWLEALQPIAEPQPPSPIFPIYIGLVSNFGVLLWCTTAAVCWVTYVVLRSHKRFQLTSSFFKWSAGISTLLLLDDFFLIHEHVMPYYLGISEKKVFAGYGLLVLGYLLLWWKQIRQTDYLLLVLAFVFLGISVVIDVSARFGFVSPIFVEDLFKFTGIISWSAYYLRTCLTQLNGLIRSSHSAGS